MHYVSRVNGYLVEDRVNETHKAFIHGLVHSLGPDINMRGQHRDVWMTVVPAILSDEVCCRTKRSSMKLVISQSQS